MLYDNHNQGRVLEEELFNRLKILPVKSLYTERELIKIYGFDASSVDFVLEFDDHTVFIQTKYLKRRRKESNSIQKFIKSVKFINSNNKKFYGIWASRCKPFDDNVLYLNSNNIEVVSCFESISTLVDLTIQNIRKFSFS
ncbi:MAG: hypothetical protein EBU66_17645 [Bacteroidetes bacterium]|nr:hypothetical protein [bacterium]NBP66456.1 hypothetical protein [Bacteroidota bacterium]